MTDQAQHRADFERWWRTYPRRVAKGQAWITWCKLAGQLPTIEDLVARTSALVAYGRFAGEARYVPHPSTWLNNWGWEDEPDDLKPAERISFYLAAGRIEDAAALRRDIEQAQAERQRAMDEAHYLAIRRTQGPEAERQARERQRFGTGGGV